jgi:hypothetical protein
MGALVAVVLSTGGSGLCAQGSAYADGCSAAPVANANTFQNASLISSSYATRPPWNVAGVDYPVGIPAGTTLTDWQNISQSGVSVNTSNGVITVSSSGVTLNGIDFTGCQTHSCVGFQQVYIQADNFTVTNSKTGGYNETQASSALFYQVSGYGGFVMKNNYIDGGMRALTGSQTSVYGYTFLASGLVDVEYNYFTSWSAQIQTVGANPTDGNNGNVINYTFKYNAMVHPLLTSGAHENVFISDGGDTFSNVDIEYNTFYQVLADNNGTGPNELIQIANGTNGAEVTYGTTILSHNTMMAPTPTTSGVTVSYFAVGPKVATNTTFNGPGTVSYNYFDGTGTYGIWNQSPYGVSTFTPNWTTDANNVDMVNGNSANTNNND